MYNMSFVPRKFKSFEFIKDDIVLKIKNKKSKQRQSCNNHLMTKF